MAKVAVVPFTEMEKQLREWRRNRKRTRVQESQFVCLECGRKSRSGRKCPHCGGADLDLA